MSKTFLFQAIQFSQTVLIQTIQFSISIVFVYTQLDVKIVLFQTIQFSISTVSISKTVLFQAVQFSINTQFSSIWPIDRTLSGATRVYLRVMAMKRYSAFPKAPASLEPHHQIV